MAVAVGLYRSSQAWGALLARLEAIRRDRADQAALATPMALASGRLAAATLSHPAGKAIAQQPVTVMVRQWAEEVAKGLKANAAARSGDWLAAAAD
jgi:hypothetical protein